MYLHGGLSLSASQTQESPHDGWPRGHGAGCFDCSETTETPRLFSFGTEVRPKMARRLSGPCPDIARTFGPRRSGRPLAEPWRPGRLPHHKTGCSVTSAAHRVVVAGCRRQCVGTACGAVAVAGAALPLSAATASARLQTPAAPQRTRTGRAVPPRCGRAPGRRLAALACPLAHRRHRHPCTGGGVVSRWSLQRVRVVGGYAHNATDAQRLKLAGGHLPASTESRARARSRREIIRR